MKIKKPPTSRRVPPVPPDIATVVERIASADADDLVTVLKDLPTWRYPRSDLNAWIPALDRFDTVLAEIISSYEVAKIQANDFTPKTQQLVLEILRVQRLLLENCTSRKLFSSYDRASDLLLTTDLKVLESTLALLFRPSQQYGAQVPGDPVISAALHDRLLILSRLWDDLPLSLFSLATAETVSFPDEISIQFYPQTDADSLTTLDLKVTDLSSTPDRVAQLAEEHHMSLNDHFKLLNQVRAISESRSLLVPIKLLALATFVYLAPDALVQSTLFLFETDLINQLAELLTPGRTVSDHIQSSTVYAFDACSHHQAKLAESLTALGANVSHGSLLTLFRSVVQRLVAGDDVPFELPDSLMGLISYIATSPPHNHLLLGAGIIPVLLDITKARSFRRDNYIPRALGLIDTLVHTTTQGLTAFSTSNGVNTLLSSIKVEIETILETETPEPTDVLSLDTIKFYTTNPLKSMLRTAHRLLQVSGGAEGFRNLVDSDLPKFLKRIYENSDKFGTRVYALAINVLATFVHNEPTSLSVLQDQQLPQTLYQELEKGVPASFDVLSAIPNAIGAICLNETGLQSTLAHPKIITNAISMITASAIRQPDREHAKALGIAMDELIRHHPPLRAMVSEASRQHLESAIALGGAFVPAETEQHHYVLEPPASDRASAQKPPLNEPLLQIIQAVKYLAGLLRNGVMGTEFIDNGLQSLLAIPELACVPTRSASELLTAMSGLLATLGERDQSRLTAKLVESVQDTTTRCAAYWRGEYHQSWLELQEHPDQVRALRGLLVRLGYLSETVINHSSSNHRLAVTLAKALPSGFMIDLGVLHRACMVEYARLRSSPPSPTGETLALVGTNETATTAAAKFLSSRLHMQLLTFFRASAKLLLFKRSLDATQREQSQRIGDVVADCIMGHLALPGINVYDTVAIGVATLILFDDHAHEGQANLPLFLSFKAKGGIEVMLRTITRIIAEMDQVATEERDQALGGVRLAVTLMSALVSRDAVVDNEQTAVLQARDNAFQPLQHWLQVRLQCFPLLQRIWEADWLLAAPPMIIKIATKALLGLMDSSAETVTTGVTGPSVTAVSRPATADPTRVEQLVDMGFARGSAELALLRARNNVAAATDMILSMPHLFEGAVPQREALPADDIPEEPKSDPEPASPLPSIDDTRSQLDARRAALQASIPERAMSLADVSEDLVYDVLPAFEATSAGLDFLTAKLKAATPERPTELSARLRLLSLFVRSHVTVTSDPSPLVEIINALLGHASSRAAWLPSLFLLAETVAITPVLQDGAVFPPTTALLGLCLEVINEPESTRVFAASALRLTTLLTRRSPIDPTSLISVFASSPTKVSGSEHLLAAIVRHSFEDRDTLVSVMRREIHYWLRTPRNKVVDVTHFLQHIRPVAARDIKLFIEAAQSECELVEPEPPQGVYHVRAKDSPVTSTVDPFTDDGTRPLPLMDQLLQELSDVTLMELSEETKLKTGLLLSILTEVVGSYIPAKIALLTSLRQCGFHGKGKSGLTTFISSLVCGSSLSDLSQASPKLTLTVSGWATSLLVALCADITATPSGSSEHLVSIRKAVLDAVVKVVKDINVPAHVRYSRLWAIGELIHRLLSAKAANLSRMDPSTHIAKLMLEKNYVALLTGAIGEIDMNFPNIRLVLASLLHALDLLTKTSIKWGKNAASKDEVPPSPSTVSVSDVEMDDEQDPRHLTRNSVLGMLDIPDDESDEDDEDEEEDEGEMMPDYLDEEMDEDELDTESSSGDDGFDESDLDDDEMSVVDEDEADVADEVVLGDEEEAEWEDQPDVDVESYLTGDDEAPEDDLQEFLDAEGYEGDEQDMEMEMDDDEEGFEELDVGEPLTGGLEITYPRREEASGHWAWNTHQQPRLSRLLDESTTLALDSGHRQNPPDARHPLLMDSAAPGTTQRLSRDIGSLGSLSDLISTLEARAGPEATQLFQAFLAQGRNGGRNAVRIDLAQSQDGAFGLQIDGRPFHFPSTTAATGDTASSALDLMPKPTLRRWQEEFSLTALDPVSLTARYAQDLIDALLPEARKRVAAEAQRINEEQTESSAPMPVAQQASPPPEPVVTAPSTAGSPGPDVSNTDVEMSAISLDADVSPPQPEQPVADASESAARTVISVHGRDVDITNTGIDLDFLEALPDDMRADVIEQHVRESRRGDGPATTGASEISPEFLNALPDEIRAEVVLQEALESARRARATLPSSTTEISARPETTANEGTLGAYQGPVETASVPALAKPKRESVQLLEKPGIASLIRLLFFPEAFQRGHLFHILVNLCENSTTRIDLLNLLLSVVQDGTGDLLAVDRSFQQMSIKAGLTPKSAAKGTLPEPQTSVSGLFTQLQADHIPTFIAQRCFEALAHIVATNSQAVTYFLTEHEQPVGLKKIVSKKGKGKEKIFPQTRFPIVILLGLLDRPLLSKTPGMMESFAALLAAITKPLAHIKPSESGANSTMLSKFPSIPNPVLRQVVNCLTVGECSSRTLGHTLLVIQNLSTNAEAKEVILEEIRSRAQALGKLVFEELTQLLHELQNKDGVLTAVLGKFTPASSSQAQLLRLLKTIDYLHLGKMDMEAPAGDMSESERAAGEVFAAFDFDPVWKQLSQCLSLVETEGSTGQVSTVLLPLVEALMVICKYKGHAAGRSIRSPSLPPNNAVDTVDLFVSFTTAHRKILNDIVRSNPGLLGGSFSLLVRNSRVLEFDNKRNWFLQKLKRKRDQTTPSSVLHLNIRRQYIFEDSFHALQRRTGDEVKYGKLSVKFYNEDGVDAGGVTREWYSVLAQQIFDPNFALFEPCAADQQTYQPNKASAVNGDHLAYFKFVGRVIGKAVFDGRLLDAYFSRAFYKQILGRTVDMRDLESIDPEYHKSLQWMLDNNITGVIDQEFTIEDDHFGEKTVVELKPGGAQIPVTEENKDEYVRLVVSYRLDNSIKEQIKAFLDGFYDIIPRHLIQIFEPDQLELLISGITMIDVDELKNATQLSGWKPSDPEIAWFWRALRSFSQEERARFLMFVTSSSRVPLGGFMQLQGASGTQQFQIQKLYAKEGSLPQASTCFNLLLLPKYESYEQLRERLQFAVVETGGFGKA